MSLAISASDSISGSTLVYAESGLPTGLVLDPTTGDITGTVAIGSAAKSPYTTTVTASDDTYSNSVTFTWNVTSPISLTNPGNQTSTDGQTISTLSLSASDSFGGTLSYAAVNLPNGLVINPSNGHITGTVAVGDSVNSPYSVTVTASDGTYSASQTFNWTVADPVTMAALPDQTQYEGQSPTLTVNASDTSGTPVFTAEGLPPGMSINKSSGTISGTLAAGDAALAPTALRSSPMMGHTKPSSRSPGTSTIPSPSPRQPIRPRLKAAPAH